MRKGIDISEHNANLNYQQLKNEGYEFAILRDGYGDGYEDKKLLTHINGCNKAGIDIPGFYHFIYAGSVEDAKANARFALKLAAKYGLTKDSYIWCDFEYDTVSYAKRNGITLGPKECRDFTRAFCQTIEAAGYKTGIYTNQDYARNWYGNEFLKDFEVWYAWYNTSKPEINCKYWQYTSDNGLDKNYEMKEEKSMALTKTVNGTAYEVIRFPMKTLNISQGCNGQYSHQGVNAIDITGPNTGIDPVFAPCTMKIIRKEGFKYGNAVFAQSVNKVLFADGTIDYASFMFLHDNSTADFSEGQVFNQWQEFGDEGTAGNATGNHCHFEVKKGKLVWDKYGKNYWYYGRNNSTGVWCLQDSISPDKACVVDGVKIMNNGQPTGSGNKLTWKTSGQIKTAKSTPASPKPAASSGTVLNDTPGDFFTEHATFTVGVDRIKIREAPSLKGKDTGLTYDKGMSVNYDGYVVREGYVWISWIGGTSKTRRWMACGVANEKGVNVEPWGSFR